MFTHLLRKLFSDECFLTDLVSVVLLLFRPKTFRFAEIGIFKGDNAVQVIRRIRRFHTEASYIGFDLFEDHKDFYRDHPDELALYDRNSYWEFGSGQHAMDVVRKKIGAVLPEDRVTLVPGNSLVTVPEHRDALSDCTMIYIDGCHEYDVVSQDWANVAPVFQTNPDLIVAFDDLRTPGVARVRAEIDAAKDGLYEVYDLNSNKFFVVSKRMRSSRRWALWGLHWIFLVTRKPWRLDKGSALESAPESV